MTTLTISLPDSLKEFIESQVQTKGYGNVSEYVRGLLRDAQEREANARLEAMLLEGLATGGETPVSPKFWTELRKDAAAILVKRAQSSRKRSRR